MKTTLILFSTLLFSTLACGMSPQFNHRYPDRQAPSQNERTVSKCDFELKTENLCATLEWIKEPNREDEGAFTLSFWNKTTGSAQGAFTNPVTGVPFIKLWMPEMGHGSTKVYTTQKKNEQGSFVTGVYHSAPVYFVMEGNWEIILQLKNTANEILDQAKIAYVAQ